MVAAVTQVTQVPQTMEERVAALNEAAKRVPEPERGIKPVPPMSVFEMNYLHSQRTVIAPAGTTREDLTRPELWAQVRERKLKSLDQLFVVDEADRFWAHLLVRSNEGQGALEILELDYRELPPRGELSRNALPGDIGKYETPYIAVTNSYDAWRTSKDAEGVVTRVKLGERYRTWEEARQRCASDHAAGG